MKITESSKPISGIVMPENPTEREIFACEELINYVEKISGALLCVSDVFENKIIIGGPERNSLAKQVISQAEFETLVPGPEGFIIKSCGNYLLIAGSNKNEGEQERGTIYAVYELLERYLGCSLSAYGKTGSDVGEYIPENPTIELGEEIYIKKCADVEYRTAVVQYGNWVGNPNHALNTSFISWLAKNRFNRILTWTDIYEGYKKNGALDEAVKRGIMFSVGHHQSTQMLIPFFGNEYFPEAYGETHPEYYKVLSDGTRYKPHDGDFDGQLVLCMRNEELVEVISENIIKWSDLNPLADVICLWPQDGVDENCYCEKCKKYSKHENYTYFANEIVKRVNKVKPNIKIDRIAYHDLLECNGKPLSENIIIDEAVWHKDLRSVGKPDGTCLQGTPFEENILEWKKTGAKVVYYDYLMGNYGHRQKWLPAADEMQAVCKRFLEVGIYGLGTQVECFNLWNNIFNYYTYARTAYDVTLSMDDHLERFCRIFGEGAPFIKEIIHMGEAIVDGQTPISETAYYLMEHIDKEKVYSLYEKALAETKAPRCRNNIRLMRMVWRYTDLEINNPFCGIEDIPAQLSSASDESGELWHMTSNFDSYISGNEGFGIAIPVEKHTDAEFKGGYWYDFE